jgi:hypothetical protein
MIVYQNNLKTFKEQVETKMSKDGFTKNDEI